MRGGSIASRWWSIARCAAAVAEPDLAESVEHALALGNGVMTLLVEEVETVDETADDAGATQHTVTRKPAQELLFSQKLACLQCGTSYEELGPNHFSFNSGLGWCETCEGLGVQRGAPAQSIITDPTKSLFNGALDAWPSISKEWGIGPLLVALCDHLGVPPGRALKDWTTAQKRVLMFGCESHEWLTVRNPEISPGAVRVRWRGFFPAIDQITRSSWRVRHNLRDVVTDIPCVTCRGGRLRPDARAVRLGRERSWTCARCRWRTRRSSLASSSWTRASG
jgi:excinuclease ABC subunit A